MGEEIILEKVECYRDCYQLDIRYTESGKSERLFVRKDALLALLTVAEKQAIGDGSYTR